MYVGPNKRFNNRKRPRTNGEFVEPIEEPFNEKLKRFAGIMGNLFDILIFTIVL